MSNQPNPKYVIVGTSTMMFLDGSYYQPGYNGTEIDADDMEFFIASGAARPAVVGDVVTINGLTLTINGMEVTE